MNLFFEVWYILGVTLMDWRLRFVKKNLHITGICKVFLSLEPPQRVYNSVQTVQCFNDFFFLIFM